MMYKKFIPLIIASLLIRFFSFSQTYTPLDYGVNEQLRCMYYDTTTNILYIGGPSLSQASGVPVSNVAKWNGMQWDSLSSGVNDGGIVTSITKYGNNIVVGGSFNSIGNVNTMGAALWDGTAFQPLADFKSIGYGCVLGLYVNGNNLYVVGCFDSLNNQPANGVAKFDGVSWTTYPPLDFPEYYFINSIIEYGGQLYVGGLFNGMGFPTNPTFAMVKWNGTQWEKVGTGFHNINDAVVSMVEYHGELYVAGYFFTSSGSPGNCVAKWNGSTWSACGTPLSSNLYQLCVYNDELYACGGPMQKWDGNQWQSVPGGVINGGVGCLYPGNGDLYVGGGFWDINGDTLMYNIAKYNIPLGLDEPVRDTRLKINPNPFTATLTVTHPSAKGSIFITDITGKEVYRTAFTNSTGQQLQLAWLQQGMYFLTVSTNGVASTKKIIKL